MDPQLPAHARPQTDTQRMLLAVWEEVLEGDGFGIDEDFFEVGGDSWLALQVHDKVRLHFKREFPIFDFSEPPTIRYLSTLIDRELIEEKVTYRSLRRVQKGVLGVQPLFLVHGGDGNARVFQRLVANLDARIPVYAFRWSGWDGQPSEKTFSAMAAAYKEELIHFQPQGPYRIGGYCIGGLIAIEMANLLLGEGQEIAGPLFIWDSSNVDSPRFRAQEPWYSEADIEAFSKMGARMNQLLRESNPSCDPLPMPTEFVGSYEFLCRWPFLYAFIRAMQIAVVTLPYKIAPLFNKRIAIKNRWTNCMATNYYALKKHTGRTYSGDIVYFRSGVLLGRPMNILGWWEDPFLGFDEFCEGTFEGYVVGGSHVEVLAELKGAQRVNQSYFKED